jgi:hypothetical protein
MHQRTSILAALVLLAAPLAEEARAQSDEYRFEAGAQYALLRQSDDVFDISGDFDHRIRYLSGIGGRFGVDITRGISAEAELNYFLQDEGLNIGGIDNSASGYRIGGTRVQGLFGVKAGARGDRIGVFGKVRPGFIRFNDSVDCSEATVSTPCRERPETQFALDLGGVVELYPSRRWVVRFDVGDTIVDTGSDVFESGELFTPPAPRTHNLQMSLGFGIRF